MFVPSNRLLLYFALGGLPLFALLGLAGAPGVVILGTALLILLTAALDAPSAPAALRIVKVHLTPTLRTSKGRDVELDALVQAPGTGQRPIKLGLSIPKGLTCEQPILELRRNAEIENLGGQWTLHAEERGHYLLDAVYMETSSRLGLWLGRRAIPAKSEIRVYPDLRHERQSLAALFFRRGALGTHQVRQVGKGREFEQLRSYASGDSYEDIYWKGTAKRRFPITKMFQLERTQEVYLALDCSRRSGRTLEAPGNAEDAPFVAKTQLERFIQCTLLLAMACEQQGDKVGLIIFSDHVHRLIPAGRGQSHYGVIRDLLYTLEHRSVSPDFGDVFVHIGNRLRHRSLMIFLTDLGEPWLAESFIEGVSLISKRHVVLTHLLGQPEIRPLFSKGDAIESDDDLYGRLAGQMLWDDFQETARTLKQHNVHLTSSQQEDLVADVLSEYLRVKKRQLI